MSEPKKASETRGPRPLDDCNHCGLIEHESREVEDRVRRLTVWGEALQGLAGSKVDLATLQGTLDAIGFAVERAGLDEEGALTRARLCPKHETGARRAREQA